MKTLLNAAICSVLLGSLPVGANAPSNTLILKTSPDLDGSGPGTLEFDIQFVSGDISGDLDLSLFSVFDFASEIIANAGGSAELDELINAGFDQQEMENVSVGLGMVMDAIGAAFVNSLADDSELYDPNGDITVTQGKAEDEHTVTHNYYVNQNVEVCSGPAESCIVSAEIDLSIVLVKDINIIEEPSTNYRHGSSWTLSSPMVILEISKIALSNDSARLEITNYFGGAPAEVTNTPVNPETTGPEPVSSASSVAGGAGPVEWVAEPATQDPLTEESASSSSAVFSTESLWTGEEIVLSNFELNLEVDSEGLLVNGALSAELTNMQLGAHAVTKSSNGELEMFATMINGGAQRFSYDYLNEQTGLDEVQFRGAQLFVEMAFLKNEKNIDFAEASIWGDGYQEDHPNPGNPGDPVTSNSSISVSSVGSSSSQASESSVSSSLPSINSSTSSSSSAEAESTTRKAGSVSLGQFLLFAPFMLLGLIRRRTNS